MRAKVVDNEKNVKLQMVKLITDNDDARKKKADDDELKKLSLKVKNATRKFKDLYDDVSKLSAVTDMTEHEIRESVIASKDWKRDLKSYLDLKEKLDIEFISVSLDEEVTEIFDKTYDDMVKAATDMMSNLITADKYLGLYSLADSKTKTTVQYPDIFGGSLGENVFKFVKEFREAIVSDQVRKADEVKTLLKHLKGDAKACLGEHHKSLDTALKQLEDNYGCPIAHVSLWKSIQGNILPRIILVI